MCVASAVTDHYQEKWGRPWIDPMPAPVVPLPYVPNHTQPSPMFRFISEAEWQEYQRLKKAAEEIDEKTNQPHCIKPGLAEWEANMEAFLIKKGVLPSVAG